MSSGKTMGAIFKAWRNNKKNLFSELKGKPRSKLFRKMIRDNLKARIRKERLKRNEK